MKILFIQNVKEKNSLKFNYQLILMLNWITINDVRKKSFNKEKNPGFFMCSYLDNVA